MPNLSVNTGIEEYTLNDNVKVRLNPTDPAFVKRIFNRFSELEAKDKAWREKIRDLSKPEEVMAAYDEGEALFARAVDDILGEGTCRGVAGDTSVLSLAGGAPIWMNILLAIIDEMDSAIAREQKAANPKLEKYLKKYHR